MSLGWVWGMGYEGRSASMSGIFFFFCKSFKIGRSTGRCGRRFLTPIRACLVSNGAFFFLFPLVTRVVIGWKWHEKSCGKTDKAKWEWSNDWIGVRDGNYLCQTISRLRRIQRVWGGWWWWGHSAYESALTWIWSRSADLDPDEITKNTSLVTLLYDADQRYYPRPLYSFSWDWA